MGYVYNLYYFDCDGRKLMVATSGYYFWPGTFLEPRSRAWGITDEGVGQLPDLFFTIDKVVLKFGSPEYGLW